MRARRQEVRDQRVHRRRRRFTAVAVVLTVGAAAWFGYHSALADIDELVVIGNATVDADEVVAASGLVRGQPLLDWRDEERRRAVESIGWVRSARIERDLAAATVTITIEERTPLAVIARPDGRWVVVDHDGVALEISDERAVIAEVGEAPEVVAIEQPELLGLEPIEPGERFDHRARGVLDVVAAIPDGLVTRVRAVEVVDDRLVVHLVPRGVARFGRPEQIDAKLRSLQTVLAQVDLTDLCAVDLQVPSAPVVDRSAPCT